MLKNKSFVLFTPLLKIQRCNFLVTGFAAIFFIFLNYSLCLAKAEIEVLANVNKTKVSLDEFLQLVIAIKGASGSQESPKITLPKLEDNFAIVATNQSNSINFKGSQMQMSWQIQYTLLPKKEGDIKIESAEITYEGKVYKTKEINIAVTAPKNPSFKAQPKNIPPKKVPWSGREGVSI